MLHCAAEEGREKFVSLLIQSGAKIDKQSVINIFIIL